MKQLPEFYEEINQLMCEGKLDLAAQQIRARIKSEPDNCLLRKLALKYAPMALNLACSPHLLQKILKQVFRIAIKGVSYSPKIFKHSGLAFVKYPERRHDEPFFGTLGIGHLFHSPIEPGEIIIQ